MPILDRTLIAGLFLGSALAGYFAAPVAAQQDFYKGKTVRVITLDVPAGTLIVLDGLLPHLSGPNHSPRSRHAYTIHAVEAGATYPADNWLQRPSGLPLRGFDTPADPRLS